MNFILTIVFGCGSKMLKAAKKMLTLFEETDLVLKNKNVLNVTVNSFNEAPTDGLLGILRFFLQTVHQRETGSLETQDMGHISSKEIHVKRNLKTL